jgi:hypothetical protein
MRAEAEAEGETLDAFVRNAVQGLGAEASDEEWATLIGGRTLLS